MKAQTTQAIAPLMALILALFAAVVPLRADPGYLVYGGFHDDGVGSDGNHYFEIYYYNNQYPGVQCDPYSGTQSPFGTIDVQFDHATKLVNNAWVLTSDVYVSYQGVSGFSHNECQINVYATNGAGQRTIWVKWFYNGTNEGNPGITPPVYTF